LRPSSGALQTVTAATGVRHELGWNKSCIDVKGGEHCTIPWPKIVGFLLEDFISFMI